MFGRAPSPPNAQDWVQLLDKHQPFRQARARLVALLGQAQTDGFLAKTMEVVRSMVLPEIAGKAKKFYAETTSENWVGGVVAVMTMEADLVEARLARAAEFLVRANRGRLALDPSHARPVNDYVDLPTPADAARVEYNKAAQWIANGSPTKALDAQRYQALLESIVPLAQADAGASGDVEDGDAMDATAIFTVARLRALHLSAYGPDHDRMQHFNPGSRYPSTFGGRHLLEQLFGATRIPAMSMRRLAYWTNWALYFSGMVGAAQAFGDGNKRVSHLLYAIILLRGTRRFFAPSLALENQLFDMEAPPV